MTWDNRIKRVRERGPDLFGPNGWRWRVVTTSNTLTNSTIRLLNPKMRRRNSKERGRTKKELNEELAEGFARIWDGLQRKARAKPA